MFKKNKDILNIALPAMGENFLQMLMGMVDSYLVANLGLIAISGVSVAGNIITIYQAIFIALGAAISSVISKSVGQKDQSRLAYHVTEALKITLLLSLILGSLSIFAGHEMIGLLGTEQAVAESGGLYLSLVGGSIVLLGLMTSLGALIRATHNPRLPLYVSFLSSPNVGLVYGSFNCDHKITTPIKRDKIVPQATPAIPISRIKMATLEKKGYLKHWIKN